MFINKILLITKVLFLLTFLQISFAGSPQAPKVTREALITINAVGDIMMGTTYPENYLPPHDGRSLFNNVRDTLRDAYITFGNLEGPLIDEGKPVKHKHVKHSFTFRTPTRYKEYLKDAGFDVMSLANNHALDFGEQGRESTIETLDSVGIKHSGKVGDIAIFEIDEKSVALIAFCPYPRSYNLLRIQRAKKYVRELSRKYDIVIVSFHGGAEGAKALHTKDRFEYMGSEKRGNVVRFAHAMVDSGAALLLGHGPHVPRAMEVYKGKLIAYSLGNFCGYRRFITELPMGLGLILKVWISGENGDFVKGKIVPVRLSKKGIPFIDEKKQVIKLLRELTREDFANTGVKIDAEGNLQK